MKKKPTTTLSSQLPEALKVCLACSQGNHAQCESHELSMCDCWRNWHAIQE